MIKVAAVVLLWTKIVLIVVVEAEKKEKANRCKSDGDRMKSMTEVYKDSGLGPKLCTLEQDLAASCSKPIPPPTPRCYWRMGYYLEHHAILCGDWGMKVKAKQQGEGSFCKCAKWAHHSVFSTFLSPSSVLPHMTSMQRVPWPSTAAWGCWMTAADDRTILLHRFSCAHVTSAPNHWRESCKLENNLVLQVGLKVDSRSIEDGRLRGLEYTF